MTKAGRNKRRLADMNQPVADDQISRWRRAIARQNAELRNRRGKRPPPPITGIRKAVK